MAGHRPASSKPDPTTVANVEDPSIAAPLPEDEVLTSYDDQTGDWTAPSGGSGDTVLDLDPASPTTDLIIATGFGAGMAWLGAGTSAQRPTMYEKDGRINVEGEMKIAGGATTEQLNDLSSGSVKLIEFPRNYTAPKDIDHAIMVQVAGEAHPMLVYIYNDGAGLSVWCDGPSTAPAWFAPNAYITFEFSFPGSIDPPS